MAEVQLLLKRVMDHKKAAGRKKEATILQVGNISFPCQRCQEIWAAPALFLLAIRMSAALGGASGTWGVACFSTLRTATTSMLG